MPWYYDPKTDSGNLPTSIDHSDPEFSPEVKSKFVEIANALLDEHPNYDEGKIIAIALSKAKEWAKNREIPVKEDADSDS